MEIATHNKPAIYPPIPDDPTLGPAMAEISPQQRAFVHAYLDKGARPGAATQAVRESYPNQSGESAKVTAYRLVHDDRILDAIKELAEKKVKTGGYLAMNVLLEIAQDPTHKDRFKAAVEIANRSGMIVVQKSEVEHKHTADAKEVIAQIRALGKELGMDERKLLGASGFGKDVIDAEFTPVSPPALPSPAEPATSSVEGLEDLL